MLKQFLTKINHCDKITINWSGIGEIVMNNDVIALKSAYSESYLLRISSPQSLRVLQEAEITEESVYRACKAFQKIGSSQRLLFGALNDFFHSETYQRYLLLERLSHEDRPLVAERSKYLSILLSDPNPQETLTFIQDFYRNWHRIGNNVMYSFGNGGYRLDNLYSAIRDDVNSNPVFEGSSVRANLSGLVQDLYIDIFRHLHHLLNNLNARAHDITVPYDGQNNSELIFHILSSMQSFENFNYQTMLEKTTQISILRKLESDISQNMMDWLYQKILPFSQFGEQCYQSHDRTIYHASEGLYRIIQALYRNQLTAVLSSPSIQIDIEKITHLFQYHNPKMQTAFDRLAQEQVWTVDRFHLICILFHEFTRSHLIFASTYEDIDGVTQALIEMSTLGLLETESIGEYFSSSDFRHWCNQDSIRAYKLSSFVSVLSAMHELGQLNGPTRWSPTELYMLHNTRKSSHPLSRVIGVYLTKPWLQPAWSLGTQHIENNLPIVARQLLKTTANQAHNHIWVLQDALNDNQLNDFMTFLMNEKNLPPIDLNIQEEPTSHLQPIEGDRLRSTKRWITNEACTKDLTFHSANTTGFDTNTHIADFVSDHALCPRFPAGLRLFSHRANRPNHRTEIAFHDAVAILTLINHKKYLPEMWRYIMDYLLPWYLPGSYDAAKSTIGRSIRNRMQFDKEFSIEAMHLRLFQPAEYRDLTNQDKILTL